MTLFPVSSSGRSESPDRLASSRLYRRESRKHKRKASLWINCHLWNRQPAASRSIAGERFLVGSDWLRSNLSLRPPARLLKWVSVGLSGLHGKQQIHPDIRSGQSLTFLVRRVGQEPRLKGFGDDWQRFYRLLPFSRKPAFRCFLFLNWPRCDSLIGFVILLLRFRVSSFRNS